MTSNNDFGLNLYVIPTTCHVVITLDGQGKVKSEFLVRV